MTGTAYLKGRFDGASAEISKQAKAIRNLNNQIRLAEENAKERELERLVQINILEDSIENLKAEANEDPNAGNRAIGVSSVRRLNSIR